MPTEIAAPRQSGLLSKVEIEEELDKFIEWPGDDHGSVTTTSCKLFANHVQKLATEHVRAELERVTSELEQRKRDAERMREALESTNLLLRTKRHACASSEVCHILDTHIERNSAALSTQPDHCADKLKMVKPEPECPSCGDSGIIGHSALCECQQQAEGE